METIEITRKGRKVLVKPMLVGELDKEKCSIKFLAHNLPDNAIVHIKVFANGMFDLRGNRNEYRIIMPDGIES